MAKQVFDTLKLMNFIMLFLLTYNNEKGYSVCEKLWKPMKLLFYYRNRHR